MALSATTTAWDLPAAPAQGFGMGTDSYSTNPEDTANPVERTPSVSGLEAILMAIKNPPQLPLMPPPPPSLGAPGMVAPTYGMVPQPGGDPTMGGMPPEQEPY